MPLTQCRCDCSSSVNRPSDKSPNEYWPLLVKEPRHSALW